MSRDRPKMVDRSESKDHAYWVECYEKMTKQELIDALLFRGDPLSRVAAERIDNEL
jgi:hypothetical protein